MPQKMRSYYKAGGSRIRYDSRFETQLFPRVRCQLLPEDWQLAEDQKDIADMLNTEFENAVHTSSTKEDVMSKMTAVIIKLYPRILPDGPGRVVDRLVRATFEGIGVLFLFTEGFMRSVFLAVCVLCGFAGVAEAQKVSAYAYYSETSTAQGVAEMQARTGRCQHFGNPTGGYEGVGFSTAGPEQAKRNCCYWGQRKPRDIGVARGPRGWFACVRYH